jgi:hypothetical protein
MQIKGSAGMTANDIRFELRRGGKLVRYHYCISCLILTFRRSSDVYLIKAGESAIDKGLGYTLLSLLLGWWGFPWGIIYTLESLVTNLSGGIDVTDEVWATLR